MSAIIGIYNTVKEPLETEQIDKMVKEIQKYPYDRFGHWRNDSVFLACLMQWITPESTYEVLPYYNTERALTITADAIIDNRSELFEKLQVRKEFQNEITDSDLILLAYEKWKEDCPKHLLGDFAFMIWDEKENSMFGARDFSGSRSLYYFFDKKQFIFSTTLSPILSLPFINKQLNREWASEFLALFHQFDSLNTFITPYENIQQLPPAHSITVQNNKIKLSRYYTFNPEEKIKFKKQEDYEEAFISVLDEAVLSRIRTPFKVGAQLSGGLDSSSIASLAARKLSNSNKQLTTFSHVPLSDYKEPNHLSYICNEKPLIKSTVNYVGNINEIYLDLEDRCPLSEIDYWLDIIEMPYKFIENSFWLRGIYEKANEQNVKVLLNGARGNLTISWGNRTEYYVRLLKRFQILKLNKELNSISNGHPLKKLRMTKILLKEAYPFFNSNKNKNINLNTSLINENFARETNVFNNLRENMIDESLPKSKTREQLYQQLYSWNVVGASSTRMSLKYSLMERDPTNDLRVIKFCFSVPEDQFVRNGMDRALIRQSMKGLLPDNVRLNNKRGIQAADWIFRMSPRWDIYIGELEKLTKDENASKFLNLNIINNAISKAKKGPSNHYESDLDIRLSMRALVFSKFLKTIT